MYSVFSDIQFITCATALPCRIRTRANVINYYKVHNYKINNTQKTKQKHLCIILLQLMVSHMQKAPDLQMLSSKNGAKVRDHTNPLCSFLSIVLMMNDHFMGAQTEYEQEDLLMQTMEWRAGKGESTVLPLPLLLLLINPQNTYSLTEHVFSKHDFEQVNCMKLFSIICKIWIIAASQSGYRVK